MVQMTSSMVKKEYYMAALQTMSNFGGIDHSLCDHIFDDTIYVRKPLIDSDSKPRAGIQKQEYS